MRYYQPTWLSHTSEKGARQPIFSLHWHPDGQRLATGGTGPTSVKIWGAPALLDPPPAAPGPSAPSQPEHRLLSALTGHDAAVLVVRWSPDGKRLATGGDDRAVMLWERDDEAVEFGGPRNEEGYRVVKVLRGHDSDVVDLAWSVDGDLLATCSLDRSVVVWDARGHEIIRRFHGHEGHVKGVAFDPLGTYLASCADDKTMRIWSLRGRPADWAVEHVVEVGFEGGMGTWFSRLSFSPDGAYLAAPTGHNNGLPTAPLFERPTPDRAPAPALSLVGHSSPIEVSYFSPRLFRRGSPDTCAVLATAGEDGTLALWAAAQPRAIAALEGIVASGTVYGVHDVAWHPTGSSMCVCTHGGYVGVLSFEGKEIGDPVPPEEVEEILRKRGKGAKQAGIIETPEWLLAEEKYKALEAEKEREEREKARAAGVAPPSPVQDKGKGKEVQSPSAPQPPPQVQRTKDGKKRIAPTFIRSLTHEEQTSSTNPFGLPPPPPSRPPSPPRPKEPPVAYGTYVAADGTLKDLRLPVPDVAEPRLIVGTFLEGKGVECRNEGRGANATCLVRVIRDGRTAWDDTVPGHAVKAVSEGEVTAVSTSDGGLHVWSRAGRRLLPPIIMEAPASFLCLRKDYLMAISAVGTLDLWDMKDVKQVFPTASLSPLMSSLSRLHAAAAERNKILMPGITPSMPTITTAVVQDDGTPLLLAGTWGAFRYDPGRGWTKVVDPRDPGPESIGPKKGPFEALRRSVGGDKGPPLRGRKLPLGWLEGKLASCRALSSLDEFRYWLRLYMQRLAEDAEVDRAAEIVDELVAPEGAPYAGNWTKAQRAAMFEEMIPIMIKQRAFQRVLEGLI
ncbi:WD40-repeat-containing domain protein [Hyaloraphidium curvatum]|nr:WD40-repeat-containing domain protein [Hyaloraphidium curvatum]